MDLTPRGPQGQQLILPIVICGVLSWLIIWIFAAFANYP
jgi:hypothetical protein